MGAWTLSQTGTMLDAGDLVEWREQLIVATEKLDSRIDLLIDLHGLTLHPSIAELYALVLRDELAGHTRCVLQYGASPGTTAALRLAHGLPVNIYPDRDAALAVHEDVRRGRVVLRRSGTILLASPDDRARLEVVIREKRR